MNAVAGKCGPRAEGVRSIESAPFNRARTPILTNPLLRIEVGNYPW